MTQAHHATCFLWRDSLRPQFGLRLLQVVAHLVRQIAIDNLAVE
jgi:hypothetical protein